MREILFRGKRLDNMAWIEGSLIQHDLSMICGDDEQRRVDPETVGQYTGLKDENGKRIFEGDIVKMHYFFENYSPGTLGSFEDEEVLDVVIRIDMYGVAFETLDHEMSGYLCDYLQDPEAELEVIGNIYDNPELLGGAE